MTTTAGPFLRYANCLPGSNDWRGSALFLTKTPPGNGSGNGSLGGPVLLIDDTHGAGGGGESEVQPALLDCELGWSFWRFDLALLLGPAQRPVRYAVRAPGAPDASATFWLPAAGQPFHWGYTSCNGISGDVADDHYTRRDPTYLWRDLLQVHAAFPLHALVGGGDQVYSDAVWKESAELAAWGEGQDHEAKLAAPWTAALQAQATAFYLRNYVESFTQPDVCTAYASIPGVMVVDDHDLWDGFGSYDPDLQACPVFQGLFAVAQRFFLLFQQHTTAARDAGAGESDFLGRGGGAEGFHSVRYLGPQVAALAIDMRTQRAKRRILPEASYQLIRNAALELAPSVQHVVALSGVPLVFPEIPFSETILNGVKALARRSACVGGLGRTAGILDRFDQPEILDDLIDGWAAHIHHDERLVFIRLLQEIALVKGVRVSVLSGDAHVGGVGQLYSRSHPKKHPRDDPLFMQQIISSAIMNSPPPFGVVKMLMRTNVAKNVDERTREKMVRAFWPHHPRTDKLIAQRNWCDVCLLVPPYAAPANPQEPSFGGLRFALRVEDPDKRLGYAEEVYEIVVPRAPGAAGAAAGALAPAGARAPGVTAQKV